MQVINGETDDTFALVFLEKQFSENIFGSEGELVKITSASFLNAVC